MGTMISSLGGSVSFESESLINPDPLDEGSAGVVEVMILLFSLGVSAIFFHNQAFFKKRCGLAVAVAQLVEWMHCRHKVLHLRNPVCCHMSTTPERLRWRGEIRNSRLFLGYGGSSSQAGLCQTLFPIRQT